MTHFPRLRSPRVDLPAGGQDDRPGLPRATRAVGVLLLAIGLGLAPALAANFDLTEPGRSEPRRGGSLRFVQEQVSTLDPKDVGDVYSATVAAQIHRGLLFYGTNLTPMPELAESWTISRDGLDYIFKIRAGARFHNGREITADDFIYSFERIFARGGNPGLAGQFLNVIEGASDLSAGRATRIRGLTALSPRTLRIHLSRPDAHFLWALALTQSSVVPREEVARLGEAGFARAPVGCGPFRLAANDGRMVRLVASRDYYRRTAWVDTLTFVSPPDLNPMHGMDGLLAGRFDIAEIPGSRRDEVTRSPQARLISRRELSLSFLGLNTTLPPFDNPLVRQAAAMCVDRPGILRVNPAGQIIATGILPPGMTGYSPDSKTLPFDLEAARALLARAGHPGGRGLKPIPYYTSVGSARSRAVDSLLVANFRLAGLPVEYRPTDWVELQRRIDNYDIPMFSLSWVADIPDPDSFVGSLFASDSPSNYSRYRNAEVDSLIIVGRMTLDPRARQRIYDRIERTILDEAPIVPLYTGTTAYGVRRHVHGLELTPLGISCVDLANVWIEDRLHEQARVD